MIRYLIFLLTFFLPFSCNNTSDSNDFQYEKDLKIMQVIPPKPVRIKVKSNPKGEYSWELTGDNVDEMIKINKKLEGELRRQ